MITRYAVAGLVACAAALGVQAQQTLADLVTEARADWMLGKWEALTDNGGTVHLDVSWDLDKHVVILHVKTDDVESKGYSALDPGANEVKYFSFDNKGSIGKGAWAMESDELVLRVESQNPDRGPWKAAFVFTGSASEGLQVRMHQISDSGGLVSPAQATFKFKKQK